MPGTMKTAAALAVIGLTWLPAYCQGDAAVCPKDPGPPLAADVKPVESPPAALPAPPPDLAIPPNADTVSTPGPIETRTVEVTPAPAPEALGRPITLDEALATAFRHNPDIRAALAGVEKGRGRLREARARFNPTFNAGVSSVLQGPKTTLSLGAGDIELVPGTDTTATLSFLLPLDISKRLGHGKDLAKYSLQMDYLSMVGVSEGVILSVKSAWYNLLRACGQQSVAQAAVDVASKRLENTRSRRKAGTVAQFDVTAAETELANLKQQLISAESRVLVAQSQLNSAMGVDVSYPTQVVAAAPTVDVRDVEIQQAVQRAYARRSEVKTAQLAVTAGQTSARLERTALRPSLNVVGSGLYDPEPAGLSGNKFTWQAGLSLSLSVWDGGVTRARVDQAQADAASAREVLERVKLGVAQEVRVAALNLREAALRTESTAQTVALAEEALRLANVRYEAGIAVAVEVTNAESQLTQARFNQVNAAYDYAIALAQLQRAQSDQPEIAKLQLLAAHDVAQASETEEKN